MCLSRNCVVALVLALALTGCVRYGFDEPCAAVTCSGHGTCELSGDQPSCTCEPGYHNLGPLACAMELPQELLLTCSTSLAEDALYSCSPSVSSGDSPSAHSWHLDAKNSCDWAAIDEQSGAISGTPDDDDVGSCSLAVVADKGSSAPRAASIVITVTNVTPTITVKAPQPIGQNAGATEILSDADVQSSDEGHGLYALGSSTAAICCSDQGALSIDAKSGAVTYAPDASFMGRCGGVISFDDGNGATGTASATFELEVLPLVGFGQAASAINESGAYQPLFLSLSGAPSADVTIPFVVSGTASSADHALKAGSWTIPAGQTSALVQLRVHDDLQIESDETVVITLQQPTGAALSAKISHTVTIKDNDLPQLTGVASIAAGLYSVCVQKKSGAILCWGDNSHGQLGTGTTSSSFTNTPLPATKLGTQLAALSLGQDHGCGIVSGGAVCWGRNSSGQLGDNSTTSRLSPVKVSGLSSGVTSIGTGVGHSCAVVSGAATCWGKNNYGQLGNGSNTTSKVPVKVTGLGSGVAKIGVGDSHSCAVLTDGSVRCWGLNTRRQLGNNDNKSSNVPVTPVGLTGAAAAKVVDITLAYDHVCARMTAGNLKCWGWNTQGQLGTGGGSTGVPKDLPGLTGVKQVALRGQVWGGGASCALTSTGGVKCWGTNTSGQVGDNSLISRSAPVDVHGLTSGVVAIARTIYTSCAVLSGGGVTCWGTNYFDGLGNNTLPLRLSFPVALEALGTGSTAEIAVGSSMFLVRRVSGAVQAVGVNAGGQLGTGDRDHRLAFTPVLGLSANVTKLSAGTEHACALVAGGMKCWGANGTGGVGAGSAPQTSPIAVPGQTSGVSQITTGDFHSCAAPATGGVWCWGWNHYSAVGDGTTGVMSVKAPKAVVGINATEKVQGLFSGYAHTCAILGGGALKCWGWNSHGQLGNDSTTIAPSAVAISALSSGVEQGGGGYRFTCVRLSTGKVKCYGENTYGQLGDGTTSTRKLPVEVSGITDAVDLAVGDDGACVVTKAGAVKCWGANERGTVGDGSFINRNTPTQVLGLGAGAGVTSVSMNWRQACALLGDKSVRCWGSNADGTFGDGLMDHHITPVTITAAP